MRFGAQRLAATLSAIDPDWRQARICVALSGGLDSTVLLHAAAAVAAHPGVALRAVHIDHGLQAESAGWAAACRTACGALGVSLDVLSLGLVPPKGQSLEAAAREARYDALKGHVAPGEWLLTAHHQDDQLETVLIQLLRGAGVAGLAAMPSRARLGAGWHIRPLLGVGREELAAYAREQGLGWHQDPMNAALRFDRGWLRSRILPAIRDRWPAAAATVTRSALHLAEAARLLAELAAADAVAALDDGRLSLAALGGLSRDRQANLLRWWLRQAGLRPPPAARLRSAMQDFFAARGDAEPCLRWCEGEVRRYRGRLYLLRRLPEPPAAGAADASHGLDLGTGLGRFELVAGRDGGIAAALAAAAAIRFRRGGESLRPHPGRPRKRLKDLCQESGVVPWMRDRLPLVYVGGRLAAVADLWIDIECAAKPGAPALKPVWIDRPRLF